MSSDKADAPAAGDERIRYPQNHRPRHSEEEGSRQGKADQRLKRKKKGGRGQADRVPEDSKTCLD